MLITEKSLITFESNNMFCLPPTLGNTDVTRDAACYRQCLWEAYQAATTKTRAAAALLHPMYIVYVTGLQTESTGRCL